MAVPLSPQSTSLELDADIQARVQRLADARHRSAHSVMCEAIAQYVAREEKGEQFRADALAAWAEYQASGLHAGASEVDAWLARLQAGEDADPPACHR